MDGGVRGGREVFAQVGVQSMHRVAAAAIAQMDLHDLISCEYHPYTKRINSLDIARCYFVSFLLYSYIVFIQEFSDCFPSQQLPASQEFSSGLSASQ